VAELKRKSPWDDPAPVQAPEPVAVLRTEPKPAPAPIPVAIPVRRINFDVPADLHRQIRIKAVNEGVTIAELGRRFFEQWLGAS
jgi:hypothetical protein